LKAYYKNLWEAITKGPSVTRGIPVTRSDTWSVLIDVAYGRQDEYRITAKALFDSQCKFDLISTRCAAKLGLNFNKAVREPLSMTITGHTIYKVGKIDARWHCGEIVRSSSSDKVISFLPLVYDTCFLVIDSEYFDIIIGHPTLDDLELYGRKNNITAPFRPLPPNIAAPASVIATQQGAAEEEREKERLRMEQDELRRVRQPSICNI
jgi:hypothetical protein